MQRVKAILNVSTLCCIPLIRKSREGKLETRKESKLRTVLLSSWSLISRQMVMLTLDVDSIIFEMNFIISSSFILFFIQISFLHSVGLGQQCGNGNSRFCSITHPYWGFLILPWHLQRNRKLEITYLVVYPKYSRPRWPEGEFTRKEGYSFISFFNSVQ